MEKEDESGSKKRAWLHDPSVRDAVMGALWHCRVESTMYVV